MKIKTISVYYKLTQDLGGYSSVTISTDLFAELEEGDDPEDVKRILREQAKENVEKGICFEIDKRQNKF